MKRVDDLVNIEDLMPCVPSWLRNHEDRTGGEGVWHALRAFLREKRR